MVLNPLVSLFGRLVARSDRIRGTGQMDGRTDGMTDQVRNPRCACAPRVNNIMGHCLFGISASQCVATLSDLLAGLSVITLVRFIFLSYQQCKQQLYSVHVPSVGYVKPTFTVLCAVCVTDSSGEEGEEGEEREEREGRSGVDSSEVSESDTERNGQDPLEQNTLQNGVYTCICIYIVHTVHVYIYMHIIMYVLIVLYTNGHVMCACTCPTAT